LLNYQIYDKYQTMISRNFILTLLLGFTSLTASAQILAINGVDRDGYGGVYEINGPGFDGGNYWWMCIEPNGSSSAGGGQGFLADSVNFLEGWDKMNTERLDFFTSNPSYYSTSIPTQVKVMQYVLDTYLPWNTLAGASGRFTEQPTSSASYGNDDSFYNAFFVVQNFLAETYGKPTKTDFSNLSDYVFAEGNATGNPTSIAARLALFQAIKADVQSQTSTFFDTYSVQHGYMIANTLFSESDLDNWQDALIIYDLAPVPEPSGALMIVCAGLVVMLRRFRKLGKAR
jgi:hypothetical protein